MCLTHAWTVVSSNVGAQEYEEEPRGNVSRRTWRNRRITKKADRWGNESETDEQERSERYQAVMRKEVGL